MIVSESWIQQQCAKFGDAFCATMLVGSYRDRRGNIFILRENLAKAHQSPSTINIAQNLAKSMANWAKSGFKVATKETFSSRIKVCDSCENWDKSGKLPKCKICGCYIGKLRLASEKCPIGKWGPEELTRSND